MEGSVAATQSIAERFFAAIEKGDLEQVGRLYAPDARIWHNTTGQTQTREENLRLLGTFTRRLHNRRYEILDRHCRPDGFSQRHTLHGTLANGDVFALPVALFVNLRDGLITELWEYLDGAGIAPVFRKAP